MSWREHSGQSDGLAALKNGQNLPAGAHSRARQAASTAFEIEVPGQASLARADRRGAFSGLEKTERPIYKAHRTSTGLVHPLRQGQNEAAGHGEHTDARAEQVVK